MRRKRTPKNTKTERNLMLFNMYKTRPDLSFTDIGKMFNITRERVRVVVNNMERREAQQKEATANVS